MEVWSKNTLYQFIEGQAHFFMPSDAKMSWALNELHWVAILWIQKDALQVERNSWCLNVNQPMENPIQLKDNSIILANTYSGMQLTYASSA